MMTLSIGGKKVKVASLREARAVWVKYRDEANDGTGLGSRDMRRHDGEVRQAGRLVARVSYNGRLWDGDREIVLGQNGGPIA